MITLTIDVIVSIKAIELLNLMLDDASIVPH